MAPVTVNDLWKTPPGWPLELSRHVMHPHLSPAQDVGRLASRGTQHPCMMRRWVVCVVAFLGLSDRSRVVYGFLVSASPK